MRCLFCTSDLTASRVKKSPSSCHEEIEGRTLFVNNWRFTMLLAHRNVENTKKYSGNKQPGPSSESLLKKNKFLHYRGHFI